MVVFLVRNTRKPVTRSAFKMALRTLFQTDAARAICFLPTGARRPIVEVCFTMRTYTSLVKCLLSPASVLLSLETPCFLQETTPHSPFFMREWPNAWEDIDADITSDGDATAS